MPSTAGPALSCRTMMTMIGHALPLAAADAAGTMPGAAARHPTRLVALQRDRVRAQADHTWWEELALRLDEAALGPEPVVQQPAGSAGAALDPALFERWRAAALERAEAGASAAWERVLEAEARIAAETAADLDGLIVLARILASRHRIGYPDDPLIADALVRGLELQNRAGAGTLEEDGPALEACRAWERAIDEVERADLALEAIEIASWAAGCPELVGDPAERAAIEAEQRRSGYRAALERLWRAQDRLAAVEDQVAKTTAPDIAGLLAQARLLARKLAWQDWRATVDGKLGLALLRGLRCARRARAEGLRPSLRAW